MFEPPHEEILPSFRKTTSVDEVPGFYPPTLGVLFAASAILLVQGVVDCVDYCPGTIIWAIVCGAGSVVVSLAGLLARALIYPLACFLLLWWIAGVGVLTFDSPYRLTYGSGNGYVASWLGFITASALVAQLYGAKLRVRPVLIGVIIASAVVMVAAMVNCNREGSCEDYRAFSVVAGGVGMVAGIVGLIVHPRRAKDARMISWFLFVWWGVCWAILTFKGPFNAQGNGFLAVWAAAILSSALLVHSESPVAPEVFVGA